MYVYKFIRINGEFQKHSLHMQSVQFPPYYAENGVGY